MSAFTLGYTRELQRGREWALGVGAALTFFAKPRSLDPYYGRSPMGVIAFLRLRPSWATRPSRGQCDSPNHRGH